MTLPAWAKIAGAIAVALLIAFLTVKSCTDPPPNPTIVVDTANAEAWRARHAAIAKELADAKAEGSGLRVRLQRAENALRGIEVRRPVRETVYDTTLNITNEQVIRGVSIEGGQLELETLRPIQGGHQPAVLRDIDVRDCDDGLLIQGETVVCNKPRFGHLQLFGQVGGAIEAAPGTAPELRAAGGLSWRPKFRSTTQVDLGFDERHRVFLTGRIGWRIF